VRLPIVSPITVRLPQLLTRNPENYPAPRLAAPRARNSWRVRAANAYSLGDDATRLVESFALRRCRWRRLQHWSADRNLRPLIKARPISRHPHRSSMYVAGDRK
jgi:hypothetical protein